MRQKPRPHEIYKHFKGKYYQILSIAIHSETDEEMVVYQQLYEPFGVYVRPLDMFMSPVDKAKYPLISQEYRFEKVQEPAWELNDNRTINSESAIADEQGKQNDKTEEKKADPVIKPVSFSEENKKHEEENAELSGIDSGLLDFLEADSYEKKLEILSMLHPRINDHMIDTMAVSLDIEVKDGDIEQRYSEILNCLITMEKFECNRLR